MIIAWTFLIIFLFFSFSTFLGVVMKGYDTASYFLKFLFWIIMSSLPAQYILG